MTILQAILYGIIQGITEFFPISSSGHLVIFQNIFGLKEPQIAFDICLHLGTLVSILIFFSKDIIDLFGKDKKMLYALILASIPTGIMGFLLSGQIEKLFGMPVIVGYMLILTGVWLALATLYTMFKHTHIRSTPGVLNSIVVGIAQGAAIIPGISRSGATIATGILSGMDKETAFRFSFLLAIPATLGATLLKAGKIESQMMSGDAINFIVGGLTAMVVGNFAVASLLKLLKNNQLYVFGIYCILAGSLIIALFF